MIVVEHRYRPACFGVGHIEPALSAQGHTVRVVDDDEVDDYQVWDMTDVLTSFCARLYGRRVARDRAERALTAAAESTE